MGLGAGTRVGVYEVISLLGAGGMGEVYRARDARLQRDVALKVLPEHVAGDADRLARFRREAQVLASLSHPNIGHIYGLEEGDVVEAGFSRPVQALVLELIEGPTLAERIAQGPLPLDEALAIARQVAAALDAAHEHGIVHRDLKPANIKVQDGGTVKVLDFGLAKLTGPAEGAGVGAGFSRPDATASPTLTSPAMITGVGALLGTAAYMSPEQAKGRPADRQNDIWAFGCVLYEMLTGTRAFGGDDVADTLAAVLRSTPDFQRLPPDTPDTCRELLQRCLEKDRGRRIAHVAVVQFLLDRVTFPQIPPPARARLRTAATIGSVAVLATAALVGILVGPLSPAPPEPTVARFTVQMPEGRVPTTLGRHYLAISPEATWLAYTLDRRLYLRSLNAFEVTEVAGTEDPLGLSNPVFSPDGRFLAYYSPQAQAIKRIPLAGGVATTVCQLKVPPWGLSWDATGLLIGQGQEGIVRCNPAGGAPEPLLQRNEAEEVHSPQLLPGGELLFSVARMSDGPRRWDSAGTVVQALDSGERTTVLGDGIDARYLPTGHLVYWAGGVVFAVPFDPVRGVTTGEPAAMVHGVRGAPRAVARGVGHFAISASGAMVYVPGSPGLASQDLSLAAADRLGTLHRLAIPPGPYEHVRASPDGTRLAVGTSVDGEAEVWIYDLNGETAMRRLTFGGGSRFPIWAPDGRRVVFQSDRGGDRALFVQDADGSGPAERLTNASAGEEHVPESWSPDGATILYSVVGEGRFALQMLSLPTRTSKPYDGIEVSGQPLGAAFSPDGRWIAYALRPEGTTSRADASSGSIGVFVSPFPPAVARYQVPKQPGSLDFHPVWSADGAELLYVPTAASRQISAVRVTTRPIPAFGNPTNLPARVTAGRVSIEMRAFDILPDGRFVGLVSPEESEEAPAGIELLRVVLNWTEELKRRVPIP